MNRGPTTFALILGLFFVALLVALSLAGSLSLRTALHTVAASYGHLVVETVVAADALDARTDAESRATVSDLERLGVTFATGPAPATAGYIAPILIELERTVGDMLGDPARVAVAQDPVPQIWVRSARNTDRWIVLVATSYRQQLIRSTILITIMAGLIALAVAAIGARLLTRPLERLALSANDWLAGGSVAQSLRGSPREVRSLATAISDASERLRNATRERELMLAGISHDLRTPLARLRIALELGDAEDPHRRSAMIDDLQQLDDALEQCLAFVRDGRDEALREIDIAAIAGQLIGLRAQPDAWRLDAPPSMRASVRPILIRRALANLIDNAERYGAAPYELVLWRDDGELVISIADRGTGVSEDLLGKLGQPFLRGDPARGGSGSGLGLSIVARIAQLHGGSLKLRLRDGGGFEALVRIPAPWQANERGRS